MGLLGVLAAMFVGGAILSPPKKSPPEVTEPDPFTPAERAEIAESERLLRRTQDELASTRTRLPLARKELAAAERREPIVKGVFWIGSVLCFIAFVLLVLFLFESRWFLPALAGAVVLGGSYLMLGLRWIDSAATRRSRAGLEVFELERGLKISTQEEARRERELGEVRVAVLQRLEARRHEAASAKAAIEAERRLVRAAREEERAAQMLAQEAAEERDRAYRTLEAHQREIARLQKVAAALAEQEPAEPPPVPAPRNETKLPTAVREALDRLPEEVKEEIERRTSNLLLLTTLGDLKRQILEVRRTELREAGASERDIEDDLLVLARNLEKLDGDLAVERGLISHGPSR